MRFIIALLVLPLLATGALAAEVKGTSRIDAVTLYPSGAEISRIGKVKIEKGEHTLLFADLPAEAVAASIRVEAKATGKLEIGSVDTRRVSVPRTDEAVAASERRRLEEAIEKLKDDRARLQATVLAAETQKKLIDNLTQLPGRPAPANGAAAAQPDWGQLFGLIGERAAEAQKHHPRHPGQGTRGRSPGQGPGGQARIARALAAVAHRGQGVRQCGRRARCRRHHPLPGAQCLVDAVLRRAPDHRHQAAGTEAAAGAPRSDPAAHRRGVGERRTRAVDRAARCRHRRSHSAAAGRRLRGRRPRRPAPAAEGPDGAVARSRLRAAGQAVRRG